MAESNAPAAHVCAAWRAEAMACPVCSQAIWPPAAHRLVIPDLKPDDVIVIEAPETLSEARRASLHQMCVSIWPGRRIVLFDGGLSIRVIGTAKGN